MNVRDGIALDERVLAEIANVIWRSPMMTTKHILAFDKLFRHVDLRGGGDGR